MRTIPFYGLLLALLLAAPASGREIFVDNMAGDDRFTGLQQRNTPEQTGPVRTLAKALRLAHHGDTIVMADNDVPYRESVSLVGSRHSGGPRRPFTIRGNGAILDGSMPIDPKVWEPYEGAVLWFRPKRMSHQQLFLDGRPAVQVVASASAIRPPKLESLQWCLLNGKIFFCVEKTKLPGDYNLSCADEQTGITLFHVDRVVIADLTVQGFQLDGISLGNSARNVTLSGVMCRGNGRSGVAVGGASSVEIDGSSLGNNELAQLLTLPYSRTQLHDTLLLGNTAPGWVDQGGRVSIDGKSLKGGIEQFPANTERKPKP